MTTLDRRQHPCCPDCGYDLLGTVDAGGRVCPECGEAFTLAELAEGRAWTPAGGYRRAAMVLAVRSLVCFPACIGLARLVTPALASPPYWGAVLILSLAGFGLGVVLCFDLQAHAGLDGLGLAALATGVAWGNVLAAVAISHFLLMRLPDWTAAFAQMAVGAFATLWIFRQMVLDR